MSASTRLVDQILHQGQRLRSALVKSILDNAPFDGLQANELNLELDSLLTSSLDTECHCRICRAYACQKLNSDRPKSSVTSVRCNESAFDLSDCLRVTVNKLRLSEAGARKASGSSLDAKYKVPSALSHTYFVEYRIPRRTRQDSRVDSGLDANIVRICSKNIRKQGSLQHYSSLR